MRVYSVVVLNHFTLFVQGGSPTGVLANSQEVSSFFHCVAVCESSWVVEQVAQEQFNIFFRQQLAEVQE